MQAAANAGAHAVPSQQIPQRRKLVVDGVRVLTEIGNQMARAGNASMERRPGDPGRKMAHVLGKGFVLTTLAKPPSQRRLRRPATKLVDDPKRHFVEFEQDDLFVHGGISRCSLSRSSLGKGVVGLPCARESPTETRPRMRGGVVGTVSGCAAQNSVKRSTIGTNRDHSLAPIGCDDSIRNRQEWACREPCMISIAEAANPASIAAPRQFGQPAVCILDRKDNRVDRVADADG